MILTKEQQAALLEASKPLIKWINDNCHPHCAVFVDQGSSTVIEDVARVQTSEFIKD